MELISTDVDYCVAVNLCVKATQPVDFIKPNVI